MTHPNPSPTRPEDDPTNPSHPSYIGDGWWVGSADVTGKTRPSHIDEATHRFGMAIFDALVVGLSADQILAAILTAVEVQS